MAITKDRFDKIVTKNIEVENEGGLSLAGTPVTATGAELNAVADVTPGAPAASQGVVLDSSGNFAMPDGGYLKPSQAVLASAGSGQSTYAQIADEVVAVTGADGTKGVALPAAVAGLQITVINDSASAVLPVAPINGGNDQINALTAGTGVFTMGPGKTATFIATSATKWYVEDQAAALPTTTELNYNDIATLGTLAASKTWTSDASLDTVMPTGGLLTMQSGAGQTYESGSTLNIGGAVVQAPVFVADATPYTVLAANSGKLHIILEQTSSITLNLPTIAAGLSYKFVMGGVDTEAQNWIIVATTPSFYNGGILWGDLDGGFAADELGVVYANGTSHLTLTVTTPAAGTEIEIYSNGTEWFVHATVISDSTPVFS